MQEETIQKYLNALPFMASISDQLEDMVHLGKPDSKEKHHDSSSKTFALKMHVDKLEIKRIIKQKVNPFQQDITELVNIFSGYTSESNNAYKAEEIAMAALLEAHEKKYEKVGAVNFQFFTDKEKVKSRKLVNELYESEAKMLRNLHFTRELDEEAKIRVFFHEWTEYPPSLFEVTSEKKM